MTQMTKQESLNFRASLKVSRALYPALYETLAILPKSDRSDFVLQVLKDWSRGRLTDIPNMPGSPTIERNAWTSEPSTVGENVAGVTSAARRLSKQAPTDADKKIGLHQSSAGHRQEAPTSEVTYNATNDERPTRTLADLGIKSQTDWNDAFDYGTPRA